MFDAYRTLTTLVSQTSCDGTCKGIALLREEIAGSAKSRLGFRPSPRRCPLITVEQSTPCPYRDDLRLERKDASASRISSCIPEYAPEPEIPNVPKIPNMRTPQRCYLPCVATLWMNTKAKCDLCDVTCDDGESEVNPVEEVVCRHKGWKLAINRGPR